MTKSKLLFDENLSFRLVELLAEPFPGSAHVNDVGLHGCPDSDIWTYAAAHELVLVSKDNDFRQLAFLRGPPPKVVWLRVGNAPTNAVVDLLHSRKADIESFVQEAETALLAIQMEREYP